MTRSIVRRVMVLAGVVALTTTAFASVTTPVSAATKNPCKVLRKSEVQRAFGGTVGTGRKGLGTPASAQCEYLVGAAGDRPSGTVVVHVRTTGAKAAYDALKQRAAYVPVDEGATDALYSKRAHVVQILSGDVLLGVQGGFTITDPLPIHFYDDETQLTDLARIGAKRV